MTQRGKMPSYNLLGVESCVRLLLYTFPMTGSEKSFMEQSLSKDFPVVRSKTDIIFKGIK